jgi:hypothetical protein
MPPKKSDASIAATPTPRADPLKLPSPVTEHLLPSLRKELTDEKKVLAGFIPSNEPDVAILETFILQQDQELEEKFQSVWDSYLKNEADDADIQAMSIYNVKDFKPRAVILAGTPKGVELAKAAGLKTHPDLVLLEEAEGTVTSPGEKTEPKIPPTGAGLPKTVNTEKSLKRAVDDPAPPEAPSKINKPTTTPTTSK